MDFLFLLVGLAVGAIAVFIAVKSKLDKAKENEQLKLDKHLFEERNNQLNNELTEFKTEVDIERKKANDLSVELATLDADYKNLEVKLKENKKEVEQLQERFKVEFENIANKLLYENSQKFTKQNEENINQILKPLGEKIKGFEEKVEHTHKESLEKNAALTQQIKHLKDLNENMVKEAVNLTNALKGDSKAQGGYGEMQLERILQIAGLEKNIHYSKEENLKAEDGSNQRLDYIIKLPDNKHLILDSKVSLTAYNDYYNSEDDTAKEAALKRHLTSVHNHLKLLSSKDYQKLDINQPDYVMLFMANEPALVLALKEDSSLFEKALEKNIVLVSTSTLLATLRTVAYIWKQDKQNKNALEIARQAGNLYDKFEGLVKDLLLIGKRMDESKNLYSEAMKKLSEGKGNLIHRVENIKKLGAKASKSLPPPLLERSEPIDEIEEEDKEPVSNEGKIELFQ